MKFETIKKNASVIFSNNMLRCSEGSFAVILPFILFSSEEQTEMRELANRMKANEWGYIDKSVKSDSEDLEWSHVSSQARQAGTDLIKRWDVQQVGRLIELFPDAVPAKYRRQRLKCYTADNDAGDWMVEIEEPKRALKI